VKRLLGLLFSLLFAIPVLACNFGARPPETPATAGPSAAAATTAAPTTAPTTKPNVAPTVATTNAPTSAPTTTTLPPTSAPSTVPSIAPTVPPTNTTAPTVAPTAVPSITPVPATSTAGSDGATNCTPGDGKAVTYADELKVEDLLICNGAEAKVGMTLTVHYVGTLKDTGRQFDSSYDRGTPFTFILGIGKVIKGWDEGLVGMKVGGKRRLTIPPTLGYGNQSVPGIPPGSTLVFEIQLISVK
jgi:FKBP-type peptidyl-prolyl cis-trans isomerase